MITQNVCRKLRCMSGNPKIIECDDMGRIRSVTSHGLTTGLLIDDYFVYYNSTTNSIARCLFHNVQKPHPPFENLPDNIHPELRNRYLKTVQKILKIKQNPSYFDCKIYEIRIEKKPEYDVDAPSYYEQRFVVGARNYFFFINISQQEEKIQYNPKKISIIRTFEEGELPDGTEHLLNLLIKLTCELELERQEYERLKPYYKNLISKDTSSEIAPKKETPHIKLHNSTPARENHLKEQTMQETQNTQFKPITCPHCRGRGLAFVAEQHTALKHRISSMILSIALIFLLTLLIPQLTTNTLNNVLIATIVAITIILVGIKIAQYSIESKIHIQVVCRECGHLWLLN